MSKLPGPWDEPPEIRPAAPRLPRGVRLALAAGLGALVIGALLALNAAFPGRLDGADTVGALARGLLVLAILGGSVAGLRRGALTAAARNAAIWAVIILVLVLGLSFKDEGARLLARIGSTLAPALPVATGPSEMTLTRDQGGGFVVVGSVNGAKVSFLVDTGASDVVLSPDDARRAGLLGPPLSYTQRAETANGVGLGARAVADVLAVGPLSLTRVPVIVNAAPMHGSLLGMSFLRRLRSFRTDGDRLILQWR